MHWKIKLSILLFLAIPAFSGFPINMYGASVVEGLTWSWIIYLFSVHTAVYCLLGFYRYSKIIGLASLIALPVILSGAILSYLFWMIKGGAQIDAFAFGVHYLTLTVTMLTVIPLSLSLTATLPLSKLEEHLLRHSEGVTAVEKKLLMALRVFNHVLFDVLPHILEVLREENSHLNRQGSKKGAVYDNYLKYSLNRLKEMISKMIQIGVEGICSAVQYIPLWAVELSQLPIRRKKRNLFLNREEEE